MLLDSGNALGKPGAEAVADFLLKTPSLTTIVLNNTGLSPDGATVVGDAIAQEKNMSLEEFRANRSRLENQGMRSVLTTTPCAMLLIDRWSLQASSTSVRQTVQPTRGRRVPRWD